jgi:hypothetical protein
MTAASKLEPSPAPNDPVWTALRAAPLAKEPLSPDEEVALEEAIDEYESGRVRMVSGEGVRASLVQRRREAGADELED